MKIKLVATSAAAMLLGSAVIADDLANAERLICSTGSVLLCYEEGECASVIPFDVAMPDFVLIDVDARTISSAGAAHKNRSTPIGQLTRDDGVIYVQGKELGRAFSVVIDELTGRMSSAIAGDGLTITTFGACADADGL